MDLKVSELARLAGISVRALHHYDEVGLVRPSGRSEAGYRLYSAHDVERLQQVLFFRELDFPLREIARMLDDPGFDVGEALRMQRNMLGERATRIQALIAAVDAAIDSRERGTTMTPEERLQVFGDFDPAKYEDEVKERWGDTEAYKESARRTRRYGKKEWERIKAEGGDVFADLAKVAEAGAPPTSVAAMEVAERHRLHIARWFYPCSPEMHAGLGELYVADPRFTENIDRYRPGLARYAREAWLANSRRKRP